MKKILLTLLFCSKVLAVGEAGAVFLLIAPGAGAVGTGEAQVAKADDVYASYYNPAGLAYLDGSELGVMHVNWLPNLADDIYYDFLAYRRKIGNIGTVASNLIYLNLGEQIRTDEEGNSLGTFSSNMWSLSASFGSQITKRSSMGLGFKVIQQNLAPEGAGSEGTKGSSTNVLFDLGYLTKLINYDAGGPRWSYDTSYVKIEKASNDTVVVQDLFVESDYVKIDNSTEELRTSQKQMITDDEGNVRLEEYEVIIRRKKTGNRNFFTGLNFGLSISNIGPKIWFQDKGQADPAPTNMKFGIYTTLYDDTFNKISLLADANKLLVARYPAMDWDGDGIISGDNEKAHSDSWYKAIFTSWLDDWYFGGDYDLNNDLIIGGWNCSGDISEESDGSFKCDGSVDNFIEDDSGGYALDADANKVYLEKGSGESRKFKAELQEMIYNLGVEYWYSNIFVLRAGYIYDYEGKISNPTFGAGLRFAQYGFDFGYTAGEQGHPRSNTMFFSINIGI